MVVDGVIVILGVKDGDGSTVFEGVLLGVIVGDSDGVIVGLG